MIHVLADLAESWEDPRNCRSIGPTNMRAFVVMNWWLSEFSLISLNDIPSKAVPVEICVDQWEFLLQESLALWYNPSDHDLDSPLTD